MINETVQMPRIGLLRDHPDLIDLVSSYLAIENDIKRSMALDFVIRLAELDKAQSAAKEPRHKSNSLK